MSRFEKDAAVIKEQTREFFWGKEEIEQTYFRKSMENFEKLNTVFDTIASQDFARSLNETLHERMRIFEQIIDHEQQAAKKIETLLDGSTDALGNTGRQQEALAQRLQQLIQRLGVFADGLGSETLRLEQARGALGEDAHAVALAAQTLSNEIARLNDALSAINVQNIQSLYGGVTENIETMKKEIDQIGTQFDTRMNDFDARFLEKLQNTLKLIDTETAQIVRQISELDKREDIL